MVNEFILNGAKQSCFWNEIMTLLTLLQIFILLNLYPFCFLLWPRIGGFQHNIMNMSENFQWTKCITEKGSPVMPGFISLIPVEIF